MGIASKFAASESADGPGAETVAEPGTGPSAAGAGEPRWYAVQCLARREAVAAINLKRQAFEVFCPRRRVTRRHARKLETVLAPYFPGYLFVRLNLETERWRSVNGTIGVARLVAFGPEPSPVPKGIVEALQERCNANGVMKGNEPIRVGRAVRLVAGPFTEFLAKVDSMSDDGRVRVLLDVLGGKIPVTVPSDYLTTLN